MKKWISSNKYYILGIALSIMIIGTAFKLYLSDAFALKLVDNVIEEVTLTFMNENTVVAKKTCELISSTTTWNGNNVVSESCKEDIVAPGPQTSSESNKEFTGWGNKGCTTGSYTAYATFRPSASATYYACYKTIAEESDTKFSVDKCTYTSLYTVSRDERYLNCKYVNIEYNDSATEDTTSNIKSCCTAKGYTWVGENFTSSGYGYEYCIICGSNTNSSSTSKTSSSSSQNTTSSSSSIPSSIDVNPNTSTAAPIVIVIIVLVSGILSILMYYKKQNKLD